MSLRALVPPAAAMSEFSLFFNSEPGERLLKHQQEKINELLGTTVGYNCIQMSIVKSVSLCDPEKVGYLARVGYAPGTNSENKDDVWTEFESLPIASSCVDVVILHHVLDFSPTPHELLREIDRVMTDSGTLITVSFKPWSIWAVYKRYLQLRHGLDGRVLRHCRPTSPARLADWLRLLNFEVKNRDSNYVLPGKVRRLKLPERLPGFFRQGLRQLLSPFAMYFLCVAKKKTYANRVATPPIRVRKPKPSVLGVTSSSSQGSSSMNSEDDLTP